MPSHFKLLFIITLLGTALPANAQQNVTVDVTMRGPSGLSYTFMAMRGRRAVFSGDGVSGGTQSFAISMNRAANIERLCVELDPDIAYFQMRDGTHLPIICQGVMGSEVVPGARLSFSSVLNAAN